MTSISQTMKQNTPWTWIFLAFSRYQGPRKTPSFSHEDISGLAAVGMNVYSMLYYVHGTINQTQTPTLDHHGVTRLD